MIERILPSAVAVAESFDDPAGLTLFPQEEALVAAAVDKRRREFTTVRHCARTALGMLGIEPVPILRGPRGVPLWPAGVVGSMTHCDGYRAATLGRAEEFASIGVDAEPHAPLPDGVLDAISLPVERSRIADLAAADPAICWDRLLFCAKEAVYKAWFPLTGRWLGFEEAEVHFDRSAGLFTAKLLVPGPVLGGTPLDAFGGRFTVADGLLATTVCLPAPPL